MSIRGRKPEPGFGPRTRYLADRWPNLMLVEPVGQEQATIRLTRNDLPVLARAFNLRFEIVEGRIVWSCCICRNIGSGLICDQELHAEYYKAWEDDEMSDEWKSKFPAIVPLTEKEIAERNRRLGKD